MKSYEVMYILNPSLTDEQRTQEVADIHAIITNHGGVINNVNEWGLKELAYEINDSKKGYYVVVDFDVDNEGLSEFDRLTRINNNVVRKLIINKDEMR